MYFKKEQLLELQQKIDMFDFYKKYLPDLTLRGKSAWCCCFMHSEQKASLSIDVETGVWKCWAENICGNIFKFYQIYFNVNFQQAVMAIAEMYDYKLELDEEEQKKYDYEKQLCQINKLLLEKFQLSLKNNNEAYNYLVNIRGLSPKVIEDFGIGLGINKLPEKESLKQLDLLREGDNGYYSTFRDNRVIIPFKDEYGNVVSFCGRFWQDREGAKYMYTSDTPIFKKHDYLFGLYQAKKYIKHSNKAILVEGPLDFLKCYQKGVVNVVGVGGLYLSEQQIYKLKKYTNNFYLVVEDEAMLRRNENGDTPLDTNYKKIKESVPYAKVYIVDLRNRDGSKCDPDEFLTKYTKDDFYKKVQNAKIYNEFIISSKLKDVNPRNIEEKSACLNMLVPNLVNISDFMTRKQYIELVSNKLAISENDVYRKIKWYNEKAVKKEISNIKYENKAIYAQKMLLSTCFYENFNNVSAVLQINLGVKEYLEPFYRNIFVDYIYPYVLQNQDSEKIDFTKFFSDLMYDEESDDIIVETLLDIYIKKDNFEDFTEEDMDLVIREQKETLKEWSLPTGENINEFSLEIC